MSRHTEPLSSMERQLSRETAECSEELSGKLIYGVFDVSRGKWEGEDSVVYAVADEAKARSTAARLSSLKNRLHEARVLPTRMLLVTHSSTIREEDEPPRWRSELEHKLRAAGLPGPLRDITCKLNDLEQETMLAGECGINLAEAMARLDLIQVFRPSDGMTIGAVDLRSDDPIRITALGLLVLQWVDSIL